MQLCFLSSVSHIHSHFISSSLTLLLEDPSSYKFEGSEDSALLLKRGGVGGHGAWSDASDVSMVPSAGYKEHRRAHAFSKHLGVRRGRKKAVRKRGEEDSKHTVRIANTDWCDDCEVW